MGFSAEEGDIQAGEMAPRDAGAVTGQREKSRGGKPGRRNTARFKTCHCPREWHHGMSLSGGWGKWETSGLSGCQDSRDGAPRGVPALGLRPVPLPRDARRVTGSPPLLQSRPRHPRPAVCSLPGLKAEATPVCGQFSTQRRAGDHGAFAAPVRTRNSSFPAHLESAAPTRPAWPLSDPKMSARPLLACPLPLLSLQCSRPAPISAAPARLPPAATTCPVRPCSFEANNSERPRFSKTTTTDCLRERADARL